MNILFLGVVIFVLSLLVIELSHYALRILQHPDRATVRKRLYRSLEDETKPDRNEFIKKQVFSDIPFLNNLLVSIPGISHLQLTINQADMKYTLGFFILASLSMGLAGYLFCFVLLQTIWIPIPLALALASLPYLHLCWKKRQRMGKFEKQLPEALSLIARALRAGHAFTSGMKLVAEEFTDPIGPEFDETLDEINFGLSVDSALKNLTRRVNCPDMKFFVVSVILQRETGGNLAEIIESLAHLIRERFKFRGKVRVLSAEGKLSAVILLTLPFLLFVCLYFLNQEYMEILILDPVGRIVSAVSLTMMVIGVLLIKRIIKVEI